MRTVQMRHVARRAGLLMLALFLLACGGGLAYVVLLTHQTWAMRADGSSPSLLPLIVMASGLAFAGLYLMRIALHPPQDELGMTELDR